MSEMTLQMALSWVLTGGAGALAYWIVGRFLESLTPELKRYTAWGIAAGIACAAFGAQVLFQYAPEPEGWRAWVEVLFVHGAGAILVSQVVHGRLDLAGRA